MATANGIDNGASRARLYARALTTALAISIIEK
jgi:hypothetical protein